jgi:hypothetical protein
MGRLPSTMHKHEFSPANVDRAVLLFSKKTGANKQRA